jgi:hypothetical protein
LMISRMKTGQYWLRMKTNMSILAKNENWHVNTGKE